MVIDSDKSGAEKAINATKARVVAELTSKDLFGWVTDGREIENYVPIDMLRRAIDAIAPGHGSKASSGRFKKVLPTLGRNRTVDKLKIAHQIASEPPVLDPLDLHRPTLQERTGLMEGATPARSAILVVRFLRSRFALRAKMFVIGNQFSGRSGEY